MQILTPLGSSEGEKRKTQENELREYRFIVVWRQKCTLPESNQRSFDTFSSERLVQVERLTTWPSVHDCLVNGNSVLINKFEISQQSIRSMVEPLYSRVCGRPVDYGSLIKKEQTKTTVGYMSSWWFGYLNIIFKLDAVDAFAKIASIWVYRC